MPTRGAFIVIEGLDRSGKSTQAAVLKERLAGEGVQVELMKFPDRTTSIGQMIDAYLRSSIELDDHVVHLLYSANRWELATRILDLLASGTTVVCDRYAFSGIAFSASKVKAVEDGAGSTSASGTASASASGTASTSGTASKLTTTASTSSAAAPTPSPSTAGPSISTAPPTACALSTPAGPSKLPSDPSNHVLPSDKSNRVLLYDESNRVLPYAWCRAPDAGLPAPDVTLFFDIAPSAARARGGYGEERYEREDMQGRVMQAYARLGAEMEAERPGSWVRVDAGQSVENVTKEVWDLVSPLTRGIEGEVGKLWVGE